VTVIGKAKQLEDLLDDVTKKNSTKRQRTSMSPKPIERAPKTKKQADKTTIQKSKVNEYSQSQVMTRNQVK
jgi:hypothetical protein